MPNGAATPIISSPNPGPSPVMVGQQIRVGVRETHGYALTGIKWSPPTPAVYGFDEGAQANPIASFPPNEFQLPDISFYWTGSDNTVPSKTLTATASVNGISVSASTAYTVYTLNNVNFGGQYGSPAVDLENYSCIGLPINTWVIHLGSPQCTDTKPPGMTWTYTAASPSSAPVGGSIELFQQIGYAGVAQEDAFEIPFGIQSMVDNGNPYSSPTILPTAPVPGKWTDSDAPAFPVSSLFCSGLNVEEQFVDYFMYQPTATSVRPSIPVDIGVYTWGWSANGVLQKPLVPINPPPSGPWQIKSGSVTPSTTTTAPTMPTWTGVFANDVGVAPCYSD